MSHDHEASEQGTACNPMKTYERPVAPTPFGPHHTSDHSPGGERCRDNTPISRGL